MIEFMKGLWALPPHVRAWVMLLALTNLASLAFFDRIEGMVVLAAMIIGAIVQAQITAQLGFVRLLGVGHFHWFPMLYWLYGRLEDARSDPALYYWLLAVLLMNGISLLIDVIDVARYALGDREPHGAAS